MATTFSDDFESGSLVTNWPTRTGTVSAIAGAAYRSSFGARINPGAGVAATIATSTTKWAQATFTWALLRTRFRINAVPVGTTADLLTVQNATTVDNFDFFWNNVTSSFWFDLKGASARIDTGVAAQVGHWYDLRARIFYGSTTYTAQVRLDGQDFGVLSSPGQTSSHVRSGHVGTSSTAKTYQFDVDDYSVVVDTVQPTFGDIWTQWDGTRLVPITLRGQYDGAAVQPAALELVT